MFLLLSPLGVWRTGRIFLPAENSVQEQNVQTNSPVPVTATIVRVSVENTRGSGSYAECFMYVLNRGCHSTSVASMFPGVIITVVHSMR